uniref:Uncharacterized protein n=1 Tax=Tanacetum cinerariifolium TaxID=118510 RepID=A0A699HD25_TANCI|nr:hypothetical protein [Tanacetum cinerariifolium]
MFDEYFNPPPSFNYPVHVAATPRAVDIADSHMSTSVDQDAPSISIPSTQGTISEYISRPKKKQCLNPPGLMQCKKKYMNSRGCKYGISTMSRSLNVDQIEICPRLPNQEFVVPPSSSPEFISFIKELGYIGDIDSVTKDDSILRSLRFVSKTKEYQVYEALILLGMTNRKMLNSTAYKTYLAFATRATNSKKARKFKKPASPSKKKTLVAMEEPVDKPAKKPATRRQSAGVQIRDTPGVSVSKKKAPTKIERSKRIELMSKAVKLKEAPMKKAIKRSKREIDIHQAGCLSEGFDLELKVPNEQKGKSIDTSEGTGLKPKLRDVEPADDRKDDEEMTHANAEQENVNQQVASDQVENDAQTIVTAPATQNTEDQDGTSSQIASDYTITSSDTVELQEFDQKRTLFETVNKTKSFNKNTKHKALYDALIESILEDEDSMDKGVADKSKRKPDDVDRDKGPLVRPDQGLKRKKTGKDIESSKKAKSTGTSKGTTKSQPKSTGKSAKVEETVFEADLKDWFKKSKSPPALDPEWNKCKTVNSKPTQKWLSDLVKAKKPSKTFDDLMSTPMDFNAFAMNLLRISDLTQDILNRLFNLKGEDIGHLAAALLVGKKIDEKLVKVCWWKGIWGRP